MLTNYLLCPSLLAEASYIDNSKISKILTFLECRGHVPGTIRQYISAIVHFESWRRADNNSRLPDLDVSAFINQHLVHCECPAFFPKGRKTAQAALKHWLSVLNPTLAVVDKQSANTQLVESYDKYLEGVAGLSPSTRYYRCRHALALLDWLGRQSIRLAQLSNNCLENYITSMATSKVASIGVKITSTKSFVNFLVSNEHCAVTWHPAFSSPKKIHAPLSTRALGDDELNRLLDAFDRTSALGKRDYAMARCLIDLGLRTSDVAHIDLDLVDWRCGTLTLRPGKAKHARSLPMPATTTDALIDYIRCARPATRDRQVFVYHRPPLGQGVLTSTVRGALRRAFKRAGFSDSESQVHRLRHTMATRLLQKGNSLKTIADVLGHLSINTTTRYIHIDRSRLAIVAMPWSGRTN